MMLHYAIRKREPFALISLFLMLYLMSTYIPLNAVPRYLVPLWPYLFIFTALAISKIQLTRDAKV